MDWQAAIEIVVARTGREFYRVACSDDRPDHPAWRAEMIRQASNEPPPAPPASPPMPFIPIMVLDLRAFRGCLYSSDFVAGCCASPATVRCHWKAAVVTMATCAECINDMA